MRIKIQTILDDKYLKAFGLETNLEQSRETNVIKSTVMKGNVCLAERVLVHTADRWKHTLIL